MFKCVMKIAVTLEIAMPLAFSHKLQLLKHCMRLFPHFGDARQIGVP